MIRITNQKGVVGLAARLKQREGYYKPRKRDIDARVAREAGIPAAQATMIINTFFDVLRDECSLLNEGDKLCYQWIEFRVVRGKIGYRLKSIPADISPDRLLLRTRIRDNFYVDKKVGIIGNIY